MLRYSLDNLGWSDFERLIQALLKVQLGLGVEAWGGSGDFGRDAYYSGALAYPTRTKVPGPFVFQAKFVDAANAAGAKPHALVQAAAAKEAVRIQRRVDQGERPPTHYVLFTNAPCPKRTRDAVAQALAKGFAHGVTAIHVHDGADVCAWLDSASGVARTFPTILGFRDLDELLRERLDRGVFERSRAALEGAAALARVFVPTNAYYRSLEATGKNSFVVLSGAPEAGKTAIGRMISLAQHARGWEVVECRDPEDVLKVYDALQAQCFFADDFFGRTEFDPHRARRWEADLAFVLKRMNDRHWLILTSRAHILHQGERKIDVDADVQFPRASEVIVDASGLTREEKARILYRHAKSGELPAAARGAIGDAAWELSDRADFTAERVRRLVQDIKTDRLGTRDGVIWAADASFRNPSEKSQKTFRGLPNSHKWFLFSLLEEQTSQRRTPQERRCSYESLCPTEECMASEQVEADLVDSFLSADARSWAHPSYRDVAIDELAERPGDRSQFLRRCGVAGVTLAVSWLGGLDGVRTFPLLKTAGDWEVLALRCEELGRSGADALSALVEARKSGREYDFFGLSPDHERYLTSAIERVRVVSVAHNAASNTSLEALRTFLAVDDRRGVPVDWHTCVGVVVVPCLAHLGANYVPWQALPDHHGFRTIVKAAESCGVDLGVVLKTNALFGLFVEGLRVKVTALDAGWDGYEWDSGEDARTAASDYETQAEAANVYADLAVRGGHVEAATTIRSACDRFQEAGHSLREHAQHVDDDDDAADPSDLDGLGAKNPEEFDQDALDDLFSDL